MKKKENLIKKIERMIDSVDIESRLRRTFHMKKLKPSDFRLGKRGIEQRKNISMSELNMIERMS